MKKGSVVLIATLCLILGFQNCGQNAMQAAQDLNIDLSLNSPSSSGDGPESEKSISHIEAPATAEAPGLLVTVETGDIEVIDQGRQVLQKKCLDSESLQELKTILIGSKICDVSPATGDICGMRYKPAYASLYIDEARINLGEELDSCGRGRKDLCGDVSKVFQAFVDHVKEHWPEMNCE